MKVDINLRNEFKEMVADYGMNILYIRKNTYIKCKCYNELHKCGDSNCKICFGTGYLNILEPKIGIKGPLNYGQIGISNDSIGKIDVSDNNFYIDFKQNPNKGDLILLPLIDRNGIIRDISDVYQINNVTPVNCDFGRTELFDLMCKVRSDKVVMFRNIIKNLPLTDKKKLKNRYKVKCRVGDN